MKNALQLTKYTEACKKADSIKDIESNACQIIEGSNDGYFIEAFGKSYRFACVNDARDIAQLFIDIVAIGPIEI